jgi:hypothetical protein
MQCKNGLLCLDLHRNRLQSICVAIQIPRASAAVFSFVDIERLDDFARINFT